MQIRAVVAARRLATAALRSPARSIRTHKESVLPSFSAVASLRTRSFASSSHGFRCNDCGQQYAKWQGQCTACNTWGAIAAATTGAPMYSQPNAAQFSKSKVKRVAWVGESESSSRATAVFRMQEVETATFAERIQLPNKELNWVLGGGLVAGSLTLVAGNPGVGKSTLALQIANMLATTTLVPAPDSPRRRVLYVSGEESVLQLKMRAQRLGALSDALFVGSETNIDSIFHMIESPDDAFDAVVVDSIQTMFADDIPSPAGTVNQVKECTLRLLRLAKQRNIPVLIIGHVTKSGEIAGPKVLEHIVDTVVQLEGDPQSSRRFLRCQKNRFGNTSEVGVFTMTDEGLQPLVNPLLAFVSEPQSDDGTDFSSVDGASITIAMEGSRPIPLEIQALATRTQVSSSTAGGGGGGGGGSRVRGVGVAFDKLQVLFAVLEKRARISFFNRSVFVNVAEGYSLHEPTADLALAVAVASAVTNRPVLARAMFLGELSLSGHLRPVKMLESRLTAGLKIGLEVCVIPKAPPHCDDTQRVKLKFKGTKLRIVEAATLRQALYVALQVSELATENEEDEEEEEGKEEEEEEDDRGAEPAHT